MMNRNADAVVKVDITPNDFERRPSPQMIYDILYRLRRAGWTVKGLSEFAYANNLTINL